MSSRQRVISNREGKVRVIFERLTGRLFPAERPEWLLCYQTNKKLELDGYAHDMQLAFLLAEGRTIFKMEYMKQLCKEHNVNLLIIPYYLTENDIEELILEEIGKDGK